MYKLIILVLTVCFMISGCVSTPTGTKPVEIYKFQKDRVDQNLQGNQGYLEGQVPEATDVPRKTKRTLIAVDIELPTSSESAKEEEAMQETSSSASGVNANMKTEPQVPEKVVVVEEEEEEYWIK